MKKLLYIVVILLTTQFMISCAAKKPAPEVEEETSASTETTTETAQVEEEETVMETASDQTETDTSEAMSESERKKLALLEIKNYFFDYDMHELKGIAFDSLDAHAEKIASLLQDNPDLVVTIEGHADERGTIEYNNALGLKRGEAVARYLRIKGIPEANINVISYGELRPVAEGHTETTWMLNRRAVLVY